MAHLDDYLPEEIGLGAVEHTDWGVEVVATDSGAEVRNGRWFTPLRRFEISFPPSLRDGAVYVLVKNLFEDSGGGLHSFNFKPWTGEYSETIAVRFDGPLSIEGIAGHLDQIATFSLVEVRLAPDS